MKWLILLAIVISINTRDAGDWVDPFTLPHVPFGVHGFFAGYLDILAGKKLFYVHTPSLNNPSKDPLVVLVSGPGCSGLHSWLYSHGEFTFVRDQETFRLNSRSWNKNANVLYI